MKKRTSYILRWTHSDMVLSTGDMQMKFSSHDEALDAIEKEIAVTRLPLAGSVNDLPKSEYYRLAKMEVVIEDKPGLLFAVSDWYVRPLYGENAVPEIKFQGAWYKNVQEKYEQCEDGEQLPSLFFSKSLEFECMVYYGNIIFHTPNGFVSADRNDLSNNERV